MLGAFGDGSANDQAAWAMARTLGREVYLSGTYLVTATLPAGADSLDIHTTARANGFVEHDEGVKFEITALNLGSNAANIHALRFREYVQRLEDAAKTRSPEFQPLLAGLDAEYQRVTEVLRAWQTSARETSS